MAERTGIGPHAQIRPPGIAPRSQCSPHRHGKRRSVSLNYFLSIKHRLHSLKTALRLEVFDRVIGVTLKLTNAFYDSQASDRSCKILPDALNDAAIEALDRASRVPNVNSDLLQSTPALDIRSGSERIVALLQTVDVKKFFKKQTILSRFTGADVEARLQFELASYRVMTAFREVRQAADNGRRIGVLLAKAKLDLGEQQSKFAGVIEEAKALLVKYRASADSFVVDRFERRLANLITMETSNTLTLQQMSLSESTLSMLLDRFVDIETMLLPLWQRNALAIAQGEVTSVRSQPAVEFLQSHNTLIDHLQKVGSR